MTGPKHGTPLPCPFCGGNAIVWRKKDDSPPQQVWCCNSVTCGGQLELHEPGQNALAAWNTRAADPKVARLQAENAALNETLYKAIKIIVDIKAVLDRVEHPAP